MAKEKDVRILEHKIKEISNKINKFIMYGIDEKKRNDLEMKKLIYETKLEELLQE